MISAERICGGSLNQSELDKAKAAIGNNVTAVQSAPWRQLDVLMLGSWTTDAIGIHSVFGGFILGVAMPRGIFQLFFREYPI